MKNSLVLLAVLITVSFAQADILTDNGVASGFESYYINEWDEKIPNGFSNWTVNWGAAGISHGVITDDPAGAHGGSFYWHLNGPDNGNPLVGTVYVTQGDGIDAAVNPDDSITFGAWIKNDAADPAAYIELGFDRFGPTPWGWGWQGNLGLVSIDTLTTEWQYFEVTAVLPAGCDVVSPKVATFGGTIYTDDWTMALVPQVEDRTLYVDADAPGGNDGSSWHNAFNHLQDALSFANYGNRIWVAEGLYKTDQGSQQTPGDRDASFELKEGVQIKGGFAGYGSADPNKNDLELYPVVLSGDLQGDDGPDFINNNENSYHVVTGSNVTASASLDGVVVTGGNADGQFDLTEGLVSYWQFNESQGSVAYDSIGPNHGTVYGAERTVGLIDGALRFDGVDDYVHVADSSSLDVSEGITIAMWIKPDWGMNCDGNNNWRYLLRKGNYGWGAYNVIYEASFHIPLVGFRVDAGGSIHGLWTNTAAYPNQFVHLVFKYNATTGRQKTYINGQLDSQSFTAGGPISENIGPLKIGGGENTADCPDGAGGFKGLIDDVVIYDRALTNEEIQQLSNASEHSKYGGGVYSVSGSPTIKNCKITKNYALGSGGGMCNIKQSSPAVTNCTFSVNSAEESGGGMCNINNSNPIVTNCTFSNNGAYADGGGMVNSYSSNPTVTNCILWGNTTPGGNEIYNLESFPIVSYCNVKGGCVGIGNINEDPLFVDINYDNLRLSPGSPCIDAGDNSVVTEATDLDDNPRIANGIVDIGAYEYSNAPPVAVCQDVTVSAEGDCTAEASIDAGSYDPDGDPITITLDPAGPYGLGDTTVTLTVTDDKDASDTCAATVTVEDTIAPEFSVRMNRRTLWPANNKMVLVTPVFEVSDDCGEVTIELVEVTCNQDSEMDIEVTDDGIYLRAKRLGNDKTGRMYTITYKATDESGNETIALAKVTVPHNMGRRRRKTSR